jgi:hypothetical protein
MTAAARCRRCEPEAVRLVMRMERHAVQVSQLGPRVLFELLREIGRANGCLVDVADRLESYAELTPAMVRAAGADRMISRQPVLVSG